MKELILTLLIVVPLVSTIMNWYHYRKLHVLFPFHIALAFVTFCISINWFATGQEFHFDYGSIWDIVERGTLDALSSAVSIMGVSCILLGWTYGDRDKVTLGQRQIEMIHYKLGFGYALSLITHFAATALCSLMLKSNAREATLWAFITVLWGCIPQAFICLCIAMNRKNREKLALELWKIDNAKEADKYLAIQRMVRHLDDIDVRHHKEYRDSLSTVIIGWLYSCYDANKADLGVNVENIKIASAIYREISERVPEQEQELFEEEIVKAISSQLDVAETNKESALVLLACGYFRFLYGKDPDQVKQRINRFFYYSQNQDSTFKQFAEYMSDYHGGLEWYLFLNQRRSAPEYFIKKARRNAYIGFAFEQLILSIFEDDGPNVLRDARLSWEQMYPKEN